MMVLIPILFTIIVLIVCLNTSLGSYWHTFIDMYSDENGVQFAQSMIYNYQQELWENNWGYCPEMDACQTEIRHSDEMTHLENKLSGLGYRFMITKIGESIFCITAVHPQETDGTMVNYLKNCILRYLAGILVLFVILTVCINGILSWWISGNILKPLGKLSLGTKEIREGNLVSLVDSLSEYSRLDAGFHYHMEEFKRIFNNLFANTVRYRRKENSRVMISLKRTLEGNNAELERDYLEANGYETALAFDGITGEQKAKTEKYDAILLDVMLPGKTGFDVCRELRKSLRLPIIMVTAKKEDIDKIRGLGLGADDYLVKPFSPTELVARVKSHIYIHNLLSATEEEEQQETEITYQNLTILPKSRRVYLDKKEVVLVNKEFEKLLFLAENPNLVFSKDTLFDRVWGMDSLGDAATVTVHINRLRDKLGKNESKNQFIETVWGAGYRFRID